MPKTKGANISSSFIWNSLIGQAETEYGWELFIEIFLSVRLLKPWNYVFIFRWEQVFLKTTLSKIVTGFTLTVSVGIEIKC